VQTLVQRIKETLERERQCFIRPEELKRVWPSIDDEERERRVREFAEENGFRIFTYSRVLGAMFVAGSARAERQQHLIR
jgi:hypothetical protein